MSRPKRALFAPFAAGLLVALAGCGGQTGLEIRVDTPPELKAGVDFNNIRVQVDASEGGTAGEKYPVSPATVKPYVVYLITNQDKTTHYKVSVRVELWQDAAIVKTKLIADVILDQGALKPVVVDLTQ